MTEQTVETAGLLERLRQPSMRDDAFRQLMQRYGRAIYWHIRRIVVGREDAEDVMQNACLQMVGGIGAFRGTEEQLLPWIYRIATREALRLLRSRTHFFQSIDSLGEALTETLRSENPSGVQSAEGLLQEALLRLSTTQRIVFNLRYFDDLSYEQMAEVTGKSVGTLKTNYHYAAERVKQFLKDHAE